MVHESPSQMLETQGILGDPLEPIERAKVRAKEMLDDLVPFEQWVPSTGALAQFMDVLGVSTPREFYEKFKSEIIKQTTDPAPTSILFDGKGEVSGYKYNENHGAFQFRRMRTTRPGAIA